MVNQTLKSIIHGILSIFTIYFLNPMMAKVVNLLDSGVEKTYLITIYWIAMISILLLPQYWVWFTDEDIDLICSVKSLAAFTVSIFAVATVTLVVNKIFGVIEYSNPKWYIIYTILFWIFALLVIYVPQVFVYEPLKERYAS